MASPAPPWLGKVGDLCDSDRYAAMTPDERLECFVQVCELARAILEERSDRREVLAADDPMPPAAEAAWRRLVRESRRAPSAR